MSAFEGGDGGDSRPLTRREMRLLREGTAAEQQHPSEPEQLPSDDDPAVIFGSVLSEVDETDDARHDGARLSGQWHVARTEIESHVSHARDQLDQANERIKARAGRNLIGAIAIGLLIGALVLASLLIVKWAFVVFALLAAGLAVYELAIALRGGGRKIDLVPQLLAAAQLIIAGYFADAWLVWVSLFTAIMIVLVCRIIGQMIAGDGRTYGDVLSDLLVGSFIQVYVPFLAALAMILLRQDGGELWILTFLAVVVAADTAAYASGLLFGRGGKHPMAPKISPKKTWEGFAGAVVGSVIVGVILSVFLLHLPWWAGIIVGIVLVCTATMGDLCESLIKRDLGIKDMSSFLPGHGGVLDRLDSILPSAAGALMLFFALSSLAVA
ncbi:phosphatidate cytidylyltransferase [Microbacterium sp. YY-01]|uniref:phosphatidate cytidylyltransferase n=1 Tax=Microbacterium sp. YY-01 TaxID=3421634 RepID=UPI003D16382D